MDCSTPDCPVLHCLWECAQIHVHWGGDAIQPSYHQGNAALINWVWDVFPPLFWKRLCRTGIISSLTVIRIYQWNCLFIQLKTPINAQFCLRNIWTGFCALVLMRPKTIGCPPRILRFSSRLNWWVRTQFLAAVGLSTLCPWWLSAGGRVPCSWSHDPLGLWNMQRRIFL